MSYGMMAINAAAVFLIFFVIWWFFGGKMHAVIASEGPISIVVKDGVYQPSVIQVHANQPLTLHIVRQDESACSGTVVFQQLNKAYELPRNKITEIILPPQPAGVIDFACPMKMYRGKIVVS